MKLSEFNTIKQSDFNTKIKDDLPNVHPYDFGKFYVQLKTFGTAI